MGDGIKFIRSKQHRVIPALRKDISSWDVKGVRVPLPHRTVIFIEGIRRIPSSNSVFDTVLTMQGELPSSKSFRGDTA